MKINQIIASLLILLIGNSSFSQSSDTSSESNSNYTYLKNAMILDMLGDTEKKADILLKNDRIEEVYYNKPEKLTKGTTIYDLEGKYIMPGLIDGHVHITHGTLEEAQEHLKIALKRGVTGVRDMGGDGRMLTLLRKNMLIGEDVGPDVYFSTIIAGPSFFEDDPRPQQVAKGAKAGKVPWQKAITHETDLRQVIAEAKGLGVTAIKVYLNVDKALFAKVATEAKRQGLKVWAHAIVPPTKAIDITNGGANTMSHAGDMVNYEFLDGDLSGRHDFDSPIEANAYRKRVNNINWDKNTPEAKKLFSAMKSNNSILDATLYVYFASLERRAGKEIIDSTRYKIAMKTTKIAYDYGVKIGAGSDHMITQGDFGRTTINIHKELELLTLAGLSNIDALRAGTIINAEILGKEEQIGSIENGKIANLIILNKNPLDKISNTTTIDKVIKRGKVLEVH